MNVHHSRNFTDCPIELIEGNFVVFVEIELAKESGNLVLFERVVDFENQDTELLEPQRVSLGFILHAIEFVDVGFLFVELLLQTGDEEEVRRFFFAFV